jgi:hypothetical protein
MLPYNCLIQEWLPQPYRTTYIAEHPATRMHVSLRASNPAEGILGTDGIVGLVAHDVGLLIYQVCLANSLATEYFCRFSSHSRCHQYH